MAADNNHVNLVEGVALNNIPLYILARRLSEVNVITTVHFFRVYKGTTVPKFRVREKKNKKKNETKTATPPALLRGT